METGAYFEAVTRFLIFRDATQVAITLSWTCFIFVPYISSGISIKTVTILVVMLAAAAKSLQSWPTLCDPLDGSPPGSPVPGILQARTLEWVAISFSNA